MSRVMDEKDQSRFLIHTAQAGDRTAFDELAQRCVGPLQSVVRAKLGPRLEKRVAGDGQLQYGLIAEEVAEVYPELVVYDDQGRVKTVLYQQLSGMLLNELQKQHQQVQDQQKQIADLTARLDALEGQSK